jgi:hypothetical protein
MDVTARSTWIRLAIAGLIAVGACGQALPRRVSGSDVTLPERNDRSIARSIIARCNDSDSTDTVRPPTSRCGGGARSDTVRSTSDPISPPAQKTP